MPRHRHVGRDDEATGSERMIDACGRRDEADEGVRDPDVMNGRPAAAARRTFSCKQDTASSAGSPAARSPYTISDRVDNADCSDTCSATTRGRLTTDAPKTDARWTNAACARSMISASCAQVLHGSSDRDASWVDRSTRNQRARCVERRRFVESRASPGTGVDAGPETPLEGLHG